MSKALARELDVPVLALAGALASEFVVRCWRPSSSGGKRAPIGRRALVTGASRGIGLGCAVALAEAGAHVVMAARGHEALEASAAEVRAAGLSAEPAARGSVPADGELRREVLERKLDSLARNEDRFRRYILEGELRTSLCRHCHGAEGVSRRPGVPSLAAQDPAYLVEQFERFADGEREEFVMSGLADGLGESDMIRLALYYASLPLGPEASGEPELADRGGPIYRRLCTGCNDHQWCGR